MKRWRASSVAAWKPYFVEGDDPMTMHEKMAGPGYRHRRDPRHPEARPCWRGYGPYPVAYDRSAHPEGLDWPEGSGRQAHRGHLPCTPGAHRHHCGTPEPGRAPEADQKNGCTATMLRNCSMRTALLIPTAGTGSHQQPSSHCNPHANGGKLLRDLRTPDFKQYAVDIPFPGSVEKQDMIKLAVTSVTCSS